MLRLEESLAGEKRRRLLKREHIFYFLMGTYLCLPSVTRAQFQASSPTICCSQARGYYRPV